MKRIIYFRPPIGTGISRFKIYLKEKVHKNREKIADSNYGAFGYDVPLSYFQKDIRRKKNEKHLTCIRCEDMQHESCTLSFVKHCVEELAPIICKISFCLLKILNFQKNTNMQSSSQ